MSFSSQISVSVFNLSLVLFALFATGCHRQDDKEKPVPTTELIPTATAKPTAKPTVVATNPSKDRKGSLDHSRSNKNALKAGSSRSPETAPQLFIPELSIPEPPVPNQSNPQRFAHVPQFPVIRERNTLLLLQNRSLANRLGIGQEHPIGDDTRVPPPTRSTWPGSSPGAANSNLRLPHVKPWSSLCRIVAKFRGGDVPGTGVLIGPRCVLTAGHVLYNSSYGGAAESFTITPDYLGPNAPAPYGSVTVSGSAAHISDEWQRVDMQMPSPFDYGVIVLDQDARQEAGTMRIASDAEIREVGGDVWLGGFPTQRKNNTTGLMETNRRGLLQSHGPIRFENSGEVSYAIDTSEGQSGAPLFVFDRNDSNQGVIIGIHTQRAETQHRNYGIQITPQLRSFVAQYNPSA